MAWKGFVGDVRRNYSGIGCADKAVCQGSGTWQIYKTYDYV